MRPLVLHKNLHQNTLGQVFLAFGINDFHIVTIFDQFDQLIQGQMATVGRIIKPAVGVFRNPDRILGCHR